MKRPAVVAILALSVACGGGRPHALTAVPAKPPVPIAPAAEVIARPGEQMTYRISIHGIDVAELVVSVGAPSSLDGKDVIVVQTHATSSKLLGWVHPVNDTLTSWIDRATGRPVAYKSIELASRDTADVEDSESRFGPGTFPVHVLRRGQTIDEQQVVRDPAYDIPSMLTFLRGWTSEPGTAVSVDVMRSRNAWRAGLAIAGFENLPTALGDLPVVRVDGDAVRIRRDGTEDPKSDRRRFSIWITADADRVPAKMVAHTDYGDIQVDLVAYRAQ